MPVKESLRALRRYHWNTPFRAASAPASGRWNGACAGAVSTWSPLAAVRNHTPGNGHPVLRPSDDTAEHDRTEKGAAADDVIERRVDPMSRTMLSRKVSRAANRSAKPISRTRRRNALGKKTVAVAPPYRRQQKTRRSGLSQYWRPGSESNRRTRLCRPLHDHSATRPVTSLCNELRRQAGVYLNLERETRLELATSTLARLRSTN